MTTSTTAAAAERHITVFSTGFNSLQKKKKKSITVSPVLVPIPGVGQVRSGLAERRDSVPAVGPVGRALLCDSQNHRSRRGRDRAYESAHLIAAHWARSRYFQEKRGGERELCGRKGRKKKKKKERQTATILFPVSICSCLTSAS